MGKEHEKRGGIGRFFGGLGKISELDEEKLERLEEQVAAEKSEASRREASGANDAPHDQDDAALLEIHDGPLLRLWRQWAGEGVLSPPALSLLGDEGDYPFPLDAQGLARERVRLKAQLDKDASTRLRLIEDNAKREGPDLNASCHAYIARSGMAAWVILFPPSGPGGDLAVENVGKALHDRGITAGIDSAQMLKLIQSKSYFKLIPIAKGTPAVEGENGTCTELYPREIPQEVKVGEDGMADYRSLNYVRMIQAGDPICDITHPVPGKAGVRVDGKVVEPKPVHPARIPAGTNTTTSEDGLHLVATREGHLEFAGDAFHVRPVLEVKGDVDYGVGNLDFHGDIHIHGDVREGFLVHATGSITVDGLVESATVEAGGDLTITCGVLGDNSSVIKSGGCIRAKYLENCMAYAAKCVYADCIMSSQIFSDDAIEVTSGRGTVIGGSLTAAHTVKARMIGSQSGRQTTVTLGVLPYVQETMQESEDALKGIARELEELTKEIAYLELRHDHEGTAEKLARANLRKSVLGMKEKQVLKRRERLEPMSPDLSRCRLECDTVYPVTTLVIQDVTLRIDQVRKRYKAVYDVHTGEIDER